jgi:serine protease DegS
MRNLRSNGIFAPMNGRAHWIWIPAAFLAGVAALLLAFWLEPRFLPHQFQAPADSLADLERPGGAPSYADAVSRAGPAVVNIFSTKVTTQRQGVTFRDPFLQRQYGHLLPDPGRQKSATSLGSGVILEKDGLILTNRHIVDGAEAIRVVLPSGRDLDVKVVGFDPETDLAVLRAETSDLPVIPLGVPDELRVGDVVLAIGNPYGMGQTVTMGIVSATGRSHLGITSIEDFIQTDASINPGNSGGALVNARGEIVGINTAIFSQSGGSEGVGFAIPIDLATDVVEKVLSNGRVVRGWIGIEGRTVTPKLAESFGLRVPEGVLIDRTLEDGPAEQAGLRPGDVIATVEGRAVSSTQELLGEVANAGPGIEIALEVWRGSERIWARTTTAERPVVAGR